MTTVTENLFGRNYDNNERFYLNLLIKHPYIHPTTNNFEYLGIIYTIDNYKDVVCKFRKSIGIQILNVIMQDTYSFNDYADEYFKILVKCNVDLSIEDQYLLERAIKHGLDKIVRVFLSSPYITPHLEDLEQIESKNKKLQYTSRMI